MKPSGKAVKIALDTKKPIEQTVVDDLFGDYRSTPHMSTGTAPGDMLFRGGYPSNLSPIRRSISNKCFEHERKQDGEQRTKRTVKLMFRFGDRILK